MDELKCPKVEENLDECLDIQPSTSGRRRHREKDVSKKKEEGFIDHDIKSPIAKIRRYSENIESRAATSPAREGAVTQDRLRRNLRENYEIVESKPSHIQTKRGTSGTKIVLQTNHFRLLTKPTWTIHQYQVEIDPHIETKRIRGGLLAEHKKLLGGGYLYDGVKLFTTSRLPEDITILSAISKQNVYHTITVRYVGVIRMNQWQSLRILNVILKRALEGLGLQQVGRNFFDALGKIDIRSFDLQVWPGYQTGIRQHERDILLCAEVIHKVMRTETLYDILKQCRKSSGSYDKEKYRHAVVGLIVLTDYNNKTYRINDVDFTKSPQQTFNRKTMDITFIDYYYQKHNIRIRDPKQPLLISKAKSCNVRTGESDIVSLVPELCRSTGLADSMRTNFQLMRALATHTRMDPSRRINRLRAFHERLKENAESYEVLRDWNMKLEKKPVEVEGRVLNPQKIHFNKDKKHIADEYADWTWLFRDNGLFTVPSRGLTNWFAIAPEKSSHIIKKLLEMLSEIAGNMQMRIDLPKTVLLFNDRNYSYVQAIEKCSREDPQFILCLVPNSNTERYSAIKKKSCLERGIPTQVITQKTISNTHSLQNIVTKIAIQINSKLGYTPWMVDMPLSGLMTVGYDVVKGTREKSKAFSALVATMDMQVNATYYSTVAECNADDILAKNLWPMMAKALRQYQREHNGQLPSRILFYRDGVAEGFLRQVFDYEVKDIVEKLNKEYERVGKGKTPKFAYVVVTKANGTRLFAKNGNPPPGTVVDDVITLPERYDFFLVSQGVRRGTVSPTCYNVLYSNIDLSPEKLQILTYKHTHLYFNWSGTTRVPAVCQYAKKFATLVAMSLFQPPSDLLAKKLYYL